MSVEVRDGDVVRLQQILASRNAALSLRELCGRSSDTEDEIRDHLQGLEERGLVDRVEGCERDCYRVSRECVERLREANLYRQIGILYDMYEAGEGREETDCGWVDELGYG